MDSLKAKFGADAVKEMQEIVVYAVMPENIRRMVTLTTPCLDEKIGVCLSQELKDWAQSIAQSVGDGACCKH
jgi:hypothetical protein